MFRISTLHLKSSAFQKSLLSSGVFLSRHNARICDIFPFPKGKIGVTKVTENSLLLGKLQRFDSMFSIACSFPRNDFRNLTGYRTLKVTQNDERRRSNVAAVSGSGIAIVDRLREEIPAPRFPRFRNSWRSDFAGFPRLVFVNFVD